MASPLGARPRRFPIMSTHGPSKETQTKANIIQKLIHKIEVGENEVKIYYNLSGPEFCTESGFEKNLAKSSNSLTFGAPGQT